ncbi:MAG TPA: hypothetical protein VFR81_24445, partial [Longimicrobium sp.]|nr:hypothetical protein [Longimicrobium sp.]
ATPSPAGAETPVTPLRPGLEIAPADEKALAQAEAKAAAKARAAARLRRVVIGMSVFVVIVPPLMALGGQSLPEEAVGAVLFLCWALMVPFAGLTLLVFAAARRTLRDLAAVMVAVMSLAASILLLEPAGTAGSAVMLDRHAGALEEIARDLLNMPPDARTQVALGLSFTHPEAPALTEADRRSAESILSQLYDEGFASASAGPDYVAFQRSAMFGWNALYLPDGRGMDRAALRSSLECEGLRMRRVGGDWYLYRCAGGGFD